ncbi:MAG: hypothetical protein V4535_10870 [Bacteroidota bacterium]
MRLLLTLILFTFFSKTIGQEKTLFGKWKTVEVSDSEGNFRVTRNDSIILPEAWKNRTKVALQDNRARIRMDYSKNIFIFTAENGFYLYRSENPRSKIFEGTFKTQNENEILFDVKNMANIEVHPTASYYFKDGELYLSMYTQNNNPVNYVLVRVEN